MNDIQTSIINILESNFEGMTWKELQYALRDIYGKRAHHGTISGALSHLHKSGVIFSIKSKRENCKPYVHHSYRLDYNPEVRNDYPTSTNKWESMADLMYHVMTSEHIAPSAWEDTLNSYRTLKQHG